MNLACRYTSQILAFALLLMACGDGRLAGGSDHPSELVGTNQTDLTGVVSSGGQPALARVYLLGESDYDGSGPLLLQRIDSTETDEDGSYSFALSDSVGGILRTEAVGEYGKIQLSEILFPSKDSLVSELQLTDAELLRGRLDTTLFVGAQVVLDSTPYFVRESDEGNFEFDFLPPGSYRLSVSDSLAPEFSVPQLQSEELLDGGSLDSALHLRFVSEKDSGQVISLKKDGLLVIRLESNITTGYQWEFQEEEISGLSWTSEYLESDIREGAVGTPGRNRFLVSADVVGSYTLDLVYRQSWNMESTLKNYRIYLQSQ